MKRSRPIMVFALVMTALLMSSCDGTGVANVIDEGAPAIDSPQGDAGGSEPVQEPRTELAATDPNNFALGSGRVTLVEFFAFW